MDPVGAYSQSGVYFEYVLCLYLKNESGEKYIGATQDLKNRLYEHNNGEATTTKNNGIYKIIWYCAFADKVRAYEFEKYLKSSSGHAFTNKHFT